MTRKYRICRNIKEALHNKTNKLDKNDETQLSSVSYGTEEFQKKNSNSSEKNDWWNEDWGDEEDVL